MLRTSVDRVLRLWCLVASIGLVGTAVTGAAAGPAAAPAAMVRLSDDFGRLPLYFVENGGQLDERVSYVLQGVRSVAYFTATGVTFALTQPPAATAERATESTTTRSARAEPAKPAFDLLLSKSSRHATIFGSSRSVVAVEFVGARLGVTAAGGDQTAAVVSYFKGHEPQWQVGLRTYGSVEYREVWPGIDVTYAGTGRLLESTFVVQPGANPRRIRLRYRGATGVKVDATGGLTVTSGASGFREAPPVAYQEVDGSRTMVAAAFQVEKKGTDYVTRFRLGRYDHSRPLIIDPVMLVYCGYIGGAGSDRGLGIALDAAGNAYVTGSTTSTATTFPVAVGPDLTSNGGFDAFVVKVRADGTGLDYAGYIGGSADDFADGIAVDAAGNAYIVGTTASTEATFPVSVGPDLTYNGGLYDAFVAKVAADGTRLVYTGYIGGLAFDEGDAISLDAVGNAYVAGATSSTEATFPVTVGPDLTYGGDPGDAYVAKVRADGTGLEYAGYIGGIGEDTGLGIAVDGLGNTYVSGHTVGGLPVVVGPDLTFNGSGSYDAFVAKVRANGTRFDYLGYIGGALIDSGSDIAVDNTGSAYVVGRTFSDETTFPVTVGPDLTYNGSLYDGFVVKVRSDGTGLEYAGYIGGLADDLADGVAVDATGSAFVTGITHSSETTFAVTVGPDLTYNGAGDAFVVKVRVNGSGFEYAGYIGGAAGEGGHDIAVDAAGNAYITGETVSTETTFPVSVGPDLTYGGGSSDAFVAKISGMPPSCGQAAVTVRNLLAVKSLTNWDDINLVWQEDIVANGYNVWYVVAKSDIPRANQANQQPTGPAQPVVGCAVPSPCLTTTCTDLGAIGRDVTVLFYYQVRTYCDAATEGP